MATYNWNCDYDPAYDEPEEPEDQDYDEPDDTDFDDPADDYIMTDAENRGLL